MTDKVTMIDKGDDFAGPRAPARMGPTILTAAVVSALVSAATTFALLSLVVVRQAAAPMAHGELVQTGHVDPPLSNLEGEVYYAVPYRGAPNLEITTPGVAPTLVEQRKDGFKYKGLTGASFDWRARGMEAGAE